MMQREQKHSAGTFSICANCQREPVHVLVSGRSSKDKLDLRIAWPEHRHVVQCCRCSRSTAMHDSLEAATEEWGVAYAQGQLTLRASRTRVA